MAISNNQPVIVEFTKDVAEFIIKNCNANIQFGLVNVQKLTSQDLQEKMISNIERFKIIKTQIEKALDQYSGT